VFGLRGLLCTWPGRAAFLLIASAWVSALAPSSILLNKQRTIIAEGERTPVQGRLERSAISATSFDEGRGGDAGTKSETSRQLGSQASRRAGGGGPAATASA